MKFVETPRPFQLLLVLLLVGGAIAVIEYQKPDRAGGGDSEIGLQESVAANGSDRLEYKESRFRRARKISNAAGYINTENVSIEGLVGDKVVLVDFWTYSCINCQRTFPYLNAWYEKYGDHGLEIVGVHSPEFGFEEKRSNVVDAVERYGIRYPVVMDNSFSTWRNYDNRYWPQKYLIGIDGFIRYEHIGEGGYRETEAKIQELLHERAEIQGINASIPSGFVDPDAETADFGEIGTPEIYFGAGRNSRLQNGVSGERGVQNLTVPDNVLKNDLYLGGEWRFASEYAENLEPGATIVLRYQAKSVNMVLNASDSVELIVRRNGSPPTDAAGRDVSSVNGEAVVVVEDERLYNIVSDDEYGTHTLEIEVQGEGLEAYTFTFG